MNESAEALLNELLSLVSLCLLQLLLLPSHHMHILFPLLDFRDVSTSFSSVPQGLPACVRHSINKVLVD